MFWDSSSNPEKASADKDKNLTNSIEKTSNRHLKEAKIILYVLDHETSEQTLP